MKALVYNGPGQKSWEEVPNPVILQPTDVIVKIDTTTICGTDLHILKGDGSLTRFSGHLIWGDDRPGKESADACSEVVGVPA